MQKQTVTLAVMMAVLSLSGCRVENDKHGDNDNVKIATPFGGMQVKTNDSAVVSGIALPVYPGATLAKDVKKNGKDSSGSADINMSFGSFQLKVKAASYRTPDSPESVTAFYRKALGRFGNVIQCNGKHPVGTPVRTAEGLTCDDSSDHDSGGNLQLKAGSKKHQHIVDIDSENGGTKFGLVSLDLPVDFNFNSDDKDKDTKDDRQQ